MPHLLPMFNTNPNLLFAQVSQQFTELGEIYLDLKEATMYELLKSFTRVQNTVNATLGLRPKYEKKCDKVSLIHLLVFITTRNATIKSEM